LIWEGTYVGFYQVILLSLATLSAENHSMLVSLT
jgi:hypothetical protein